MARKPTKRPKARRRRQTVLSSIRVPLDDWLALQEVADTETKLTGRPVTRSALVQQAIHEWLENNTELY